MKLKTFNLKTTKSTNDVAIKKIKSGFKAGIVISENQTNGRGQYGRKWKSFKGNVFISIFFKINKNASLKKLTINNCNLIKNSIKKFLPMQISTKLPNDLLVNREKICGILQETINFDERKYVIVGVGLNVVKSPYIKAYPTGFINKYLKKNVSSKNVIRVIKQTFEKKIN